MEEKEKRTVEDSSPIDVDVGTAADVEAVMKKYDRESNTKIWEGLPKQVIRYAMALFMIFMVYVSMFSSMDGSVRRCWFLGLVLVFVYVMYPIKKGAVTRVNYMPWYDIVLAVLSIGTFGYQIYFLDDLIYKGSRLDTIDIIIGTLAILLLIEACRRVVGIPIIVVVVAFMAYALLGSGMAFKDLIYTLFYTTQGILGTPIQVCSTYIFLFVGPAKVAVISSALCGMVSGSSVGNTVTTGSVTIPLMKKTGYPPQFAGAVEAAASTGGQIMPPIMGAAAFLMAEMTGESYNTIIVRAILPAFLYFAGIFIMVHFKAKSMGLKGLKRSELPKFRDIWPKFYLLLPLVVLVYTVMQTGSFTMAYCAVVSSLVAIVASMMDREKSVGRKLLMLIPGIPLLIYAFGMPNLTAIFPNATSQELYAYRDLMTTWFLPIFFVLFIIFTLISEPNRKNVQTYVTALEGGTKSCLSVGVACGMAGIVAGVVTSTGLGQIIINAIVAVAGDQLIIALVLTMLCCIVLGMGVPTTANYVIMATTCAPILIQMGVPLMAAHFFVFYFGIVADITPPVALAAYAGSAIAKADPMKTGLNATRLAIAAFIVPYIFVFSPIMLFIGEYTVFDVVRIVVTSSCGMFLLGAGLIGFMLRKLNMVLRLVCIAAGLCMIDPGAFTDLIGAAVLVVMIVYQVMLNKKEAVRPA